MPEETASLEMVIADDLNGSHPIRVPARERREASEEPARQAHDGKDRVLDAVRRGK